MPLNQHLPVGRTSSRSRARSAWASVARRYRPVGYGISWVANFSHQINRLSKQLFSNKATNW